jgi:O-antigen/teichoic acid export membrane protein
MRIGTKEILWNYIATTLKIGASGFLIPLVLRMMPSEMVGIWSVFLSVTTLIYLFDFGFGPSFTRNITYVYSGVKNLKVNGFEKVDLNNAETDFSLLKGLINAMKWLYFRIAIILLILLLTLGTYYLRYILRNYSGNREEVYISWVILCLINSYYLFTLYYDSLLLGKGQVKTSKQIVIVGQIIYLIFASLLILMGFGLIALVSAQALSIIASRLMAHRCFYTYELKRIFNHTIPISQKAILKTITPNAIKIGMTFLGGFLVLRSGIFIGSLYLSLSEIASFGITMQLISIIAGLGSIYTVTYQPLISQLRVEHNNKAIKLLYLKGQVVLILTYLTCGILIILLGNWAINFVHSKTQLLPQLLVFIALLISFLESNHSLAGSVLLSKNEVPFFKASLISGVGTVILLFLLLQFTTLGIWAMVISPGVAQLAYQNWKWPLEVTKDIDIKFKDFNIWESF